MTVAIPQFLIDVALASGVPERRIQPLWERHVEWSDARKQDYGGRSWRMLCEAAAKDEPDPDTVDRTDPEVLRMRRLEREAKDAEEVAYRREAISLPDYLAQLRERATSDPGIPIADTERALGRVRAPYPGEDVISWLLDALRAS